MTTGLGFQPLGGRQKGPMLAASGGLFPTLPSLVSPGERRVESSRTSQVLEATGESHGYREGLGLLSLGMWVTLPGEHCPLGAKGPDGPIHAGRQSGPGSGARTARSPCSC